MLWSDPFETHAASGESYLNPRLGGDIAIGDALTVGAQQPAMS